MQPRSTPADDLVRRDLAVLWHPCTQMKDHEDVPLLAIRRGRGAWLEDADGRRYLDAISSWWVNLYGHCHPQLVAAVQRRINAQVRLRIAPWRRDSRDHRFEVRGPDTFERDLFPGDRSGHKVGARFDPVSDNGVFAALQASDALDTNLVGAGAFDPRTHHVEAIGEIDDFRLARHVLQNCVALRQYSGEHRVLGCAN